MPYKTLELYLIVKKELGKLDLYSYKSTEILEKIAQILLTK